MFRLLLLLALPFLLCTRARAQTAGPEIPLDSRIERVTVFLDGAQVNRGATATVPAGRSTLVFTGLTADLDPASVQVAAGEEALTILAVSHRLHFPETATPDAGDRSLQDRVAALEDRRRRLETELAIAREEEELLRANRQLAGAASGLDAEDLERGVRFHRERITAIRMTYLALSDSLRANRAARELLQRRISERGLDREQPARSEVVVVTEAAAAVDATLRLTYLVADAGWTPEYDIRVSDISRPVDLRYRANVHQRSGEAWTDVELVLSTGDPTLSAAAPELAVWRLTPGRRPPTYPTLQQLERLAALAAPGGYRTVTGYLTDESGEPLIGAAVLVPGTPVGTVTDLDGRYTLALPEGAERLEVSYTGFRTLTVPITSARLDLQMDDEGIELEEVVVTGYAADATASGTAGGRTPRKTRADRNRAATAAPPPVPTTVQRRATTVAFAIELPYTIPSDGKDRRVEIRQHDVPATYRHFAVPKLSPDAYLTAALTDWEQYDLISGDLQLFFEGTYLGKSYLDVDNTSDTLELSLGRDPGVIVTRTADTEYRRGGGLLGGKRVDARGWVIRVRNVKSQPVHLTVLDQVPVSGDGDLDVGLELPEEAVLDPRSGEVRWTFRLPPQVERATTFGYRVRYPRHRTVYLE